MKRILTTGFLLCCFLSTGCVGWGPHGTEQLHGPLAGGYLSHERPCGNCGVVAPIFAGLRNALFCGAGCGEVYYGEWVSNPPEPCHDCDVSAHAYGSNLSVPWIRPFRLLGFRYDVTDQGYGTSIRGAETGYGYDAGIPVGCAECGDHTCQGCQKVHTQPKIHSGRELTPVPEKRELIPEKQTSFISPRLRSNDLRSPHR